MIFQQIQKILGLSRSWGMAGIQLCPNIDENVLDGCKQIFADIDIKQILVVANASAFGSGKFVAGMAITFDRFYYTDEQDKGHFIYWNDLHRVTVSGKKTLLSYGKIALFTKAGQIQLDSCLVGFDVEKVAATLEEYSQIFASFPLKMFSETLSLEELHPAIKYAYLQCLCNAVRSDATEISQIQYMKLQKIMTRIALSAQKRTEIQDYLNMPAEKLYKTGPLLSAIFNEISFGTAMIISASVVQDVMYLFFQEEQTCFSNSKFIQGLQRFLGITEPQAKVLENAVILNSEMQKENANLPQLQKELKELRKQAIRLWIPLEALFCSGSVYSVDDFLQSRQKRMQSVTMQRELMLQAVIRNSQKTVNFLVEDLNATTQKLLQAIQRQDMNEQKMKILAEKLYLFSQSAHQMAQESQESERIALKQEIQQMLENIGDEARSNLLNELASYVDENNRLRSDLTTDELLKLKRLLKQVTINE